jgi:hypothetical protein
MTEDQKLHEDQAARLAYLRETYGDDVAIGLGLDQTTPKGRSSAEQIAGRRRGGEQQAAQNRRLAGLRRVAQEQREDEALDLAVGQINQGRTPDTETTILAARAQARRGGSGLSSAERLAAPSLTRRQVEDLFHLDDDRRDGRRP